MSWARESTRPRCRQGAGMRKNIFNLAICAIFCGLAIVGGKLVIPAGPIPFTLQTAVCFMTGLLLGSRRALAAQGLYLLIGLAGLPVFAAGGGPAYVLQPSFGYLPGMVLAAALIGHLADRADPQRNGLKLFSALAINAAGLAVVYLCGTGYLYVLKNIVSGDSTGLVRILQIGMIPYLATDGLFALLTASVAPRLRRATRRYFLA